MLIYRLVLSLVLPALIWRAGATWRARWRGPVTDQPFFWLHGASVGELTSAQPIIAALSDRPLLVTCNTTTARDMVQSWGLVHVTAALAPFDRARVARRLMRDCQGLIILENELWPNRINTAHRAGVPVVLLSARMSDQSARVWHRFERLARQIMVPMRLVLPQDANSAKNLSDLGVPSDALHPPVQLKAAYHPTTRKGHPAFTRTRTLLAASTHEDEDLMVCRAFAATLTERPDLRLIIAPRHAQRATAIASKLKDLDLPYSLHSTGDTPNQTVHIADTLGQMDLWYASAGLCFIGGSLVNRGGHTPFEPIAHNLPILHGPYTRNFAESYANLDAEGGALCVTDQASLSEAFLTHLNNTDMARSAQTTLPPVDINAVVSTIKTHLTA